LAGAPLAKITPVGDAAGDRETPALRTDRELRRGDHVPHHVWPADVGVTAIAAAVGEPQLAGGELTCGAHLLQMRAQRRRGVGVGAQPQELERAGYLPVGREFPVFLHPQTREEYALARRERKVAPGYRGFTTQSSPEVTLQEDLQRRDLTINAMAQSEDGEIVDPYGGQADLAARVLRHVSEAFVED